MNIQAQQSLPGSTTRRRVVVVGGGVVGCATAYRLARAGLAVTLIERDAIGAHASAFNAGNLNPLYGTPPALLPAAIDAFHLHVDLAEELRLLGCAPGAPHPVKRILLGFEAAERAALETTAALFEATPGFSSTWLERGQLRRVEPGLADEVAFGLLLEGSLSIDGHDFTRSLAAGAARAGCEVAIGAVTGVMTHDDRVTGVRTAGGVVDCDEAVFATGPWVSELESWLGIEVGVQPVKGELLLVELPAEQPLHDLSWESVAIYRRRDAQIWVGGTMEKSGFDAKPTAAARTAMLARAERIFPAMRRAEIMRHVAALRPMGPGHVPIAMRANGWKNAYIANGAGTKGLLLSVVIARTISELLTGRGIEHALDTAAV